jgi:hypothetical protein
MPELVQLFRVFVGAPSDVTEEHSIISELVEEWNRHHGPFTRARLEFMNWRTHSHPSAGARPQALLNKQVVDQSDIVVGLFRLRFGSPTGVADSGTEEEIQRSIEQGKEVMVYFARLPEPRRRKEREEFARVEKFKSKYKNQALYDTYTDLTAFAKAFRQHLAAAMTELLAKHVLHRSTTPRSRSEAKSPLHKSRQRAKEYPAGSIGAHLAQRNYVKYLVERYHRYREAEGNSGRIPRFHYAAVFKNIETKFKAPTYFIPQGRFTELVKYLQRRIDETILGKANGKRGIRNYEPFDEYVTKHMGNSTTKVLRGRAASKLE